MHMNASQAASSVLTAVSEGKITSIQETRVMALNESRNHYRRESSTNQENNMISDAKKARQDKRKLEGKFIPSL